MADRLRIAIAGLGRMGHVHAKNLAELSREGACEIVALVDADPRRAEKVRQECCPGATAFASIDDLAASGLCNASVLVTPTEWHQRHATALLRAGHRILLEKPLTGTLEGDSQFGAMLDRDYPTGVMIAFQRRFDPALRYARQLVTEGAVGRLFKIYSALEDSGPPPEGYQSGGILPDMSIHNVDEVLWLTGEMPVSALAIGSRVYNHFVASCKEDFDDAMLHMWFERDLIAQVQVSRNHVSGYRVETVIYGEKGQIQIGHFAQMPEEIVVKVFGRRGALTPIAQRAFPGEIDSFDTPEFVPRFRSAYKGEVGEFIECCKTGDAFSVTHNDALRAQTVIAAAMRTMLSAEQASPIARTIPVL